MKLFIAEKSSLAQAIAAGIGVGKKFDGYISVNDGKEIVTWCYGHILEQLSPNEYAEKYRAWRMEDLPIIPSAWKLKVKPDAAKQFKVVCELISKATTIINAGDPDREGQLLVDEMLDYVGNKKPVQRILLNALGKKSTKPKSNNLVKSNSNVSKTGKAPTMIVSSIISRLTTALSTAKNSTTTSLLTILPPIPITTTNAIANEFKTKSRPNVQAALRPLASPIHF